MFQNIDYMCDSFRHNYEHQELRKWSWLRSELKAGLEACETEFVALDAGKIIKEAKERRKAHGR